jgi:response regulator RpfG family c-di-GMP phosphodiesterase
MSIKILCVDDDSHILSAYQRNLRKQFTIDTALGGSQALAAMSNNGPYAVVVADMQMPGMNGVQFLTQAEALAPETVRIMLTGNADQKTAAEAVNEGHVFRFLTKPCSPEQLALTLQAGLKQYRLITAERELLHNTLNGSVKLLTDILSMTDPQSFGQAQTLREYMRTYLRPLKLESTWEFELAAMLSSIGLVSIPAPVLYKARSGLSLTGPEKDMLARVPETGAKLLANIPRLETVARIVRYQNKRFDGAGFPTDSVAGDEIPIASRILKVLSDLLRLEAKGIPRFKALEQMQEQRGSYDPRVLDATFACFDVYLRTASEVKGASSPISFKDLRVTHVLSADLFTEEGTLIVSSGTEITQMIMEKIRNFEELSGIREPIFIQTQHPNSVATAA